MRSRMQTILVVDDNPNNIDIIVELLSHYNILVSLDAQNALSLLKSNNVDLILLDIMMPVMDGIAMAKILKSQSETKNIPILFLTARNDDESIEEGFKVGGSDFIIKPFRPRELLARVKTHLQMYMQLQELEYSANFDYLSGARNRRSFFKLAKNYLDEASVGTLFAIMIDIDKFKNVNDTYGHSVGDFVIKALSDTISSFLNDTMLFARMGGEEFVILIKETQKEFVQNWVETLRLHVEKLKIETEGQTVSFTISCGVAQFQDSNQPIDALLDRADQGLYEAKENGRNRVIFRV